MTTRPTVEVPMVIGMTVEAGQRAAGDSEVVLATEDPDGPPLVALLWPRSFEYVIVSQQPLAGQRVHPYDSVVVTYRMATGKAGVRKPRRPKPAPGSLSVARLLDDARGTNLTS